MSDFLGTLLIIGIILSIIKLLRLASKEDSENKR